ncbi:MAG: hypothetical protein PHY09_11530 [Desulfuromonadaceae bacterium]|nr:hypothetical protein [Desulfuromonadaceae bacterium]MDD5106756.1 hypothetical protein [Desulfuromonadaceae bacterium]
MFLIEWQSVSDHFPDFRKMVFVKLPTMKFWAILLTLTKWSIWLTHYLKTFSTLRSDTSRSSWTAATKYRARISRSWLTVVTLSAPETAPES